MENSVSAECKLKKTIEFDSLRINLLLFHFSKILHSEFRSMFSVLKWASSFTLQHIKRYYLIFFFGNLIFCFHSNVTLNHHHHRTSKPTRKKKCWMFFLIKIKGPMLFGERSIEEYGVNKTCNISELKTMNRWYMCACMFLWRADWGSA